MRVGYEVRGRVRSPRIATDVALHLLQEMERLHRGRDGLVTDGGIGKQDISDRDGSTLMLPRFKKSRVDRFPCGLRLRVERYGRRYSA
jgi:hypothetical protein